MASLAAEASSELEKAMKPYSRLMGKPGLLRRFDEGEKRQGKKKLGHSDICVSLKQDKAGEGEETGRARMSLGISILSMAP